MSPENIEPPKSPAEIYALDTATSYQYILKLRYAGMIDEGILLWIPSKPDRHPLWQG